MADRQLSELIKRQANNTLIAHYTTIEGLMGLLGSMTLQNEKKTIKMWASNIYALNDPSEFIYGYKVIRKWLPKIETELRINEEDKMSKIWSTCQIPKNKHKLYNRELADSLYTQNRAPYVISFSREIDNLAMFRMYSQNATGVCILFSLGELEQMCKLYDVCYDEEIGEMEYSPYDMLKTEYKLYINKLHEQELDNKKKFNLMLEHLVTYTSITAPFIKRGDYKYEREIRYSELCNYNANILFRTNKNGSIIPYKEVAVPFSAIKKVIIGPCANYYALKYAIGLKFKTLGITEMPEIIISRNEYRNF